MLVIGLVLTRGKTSILLGNYAAEILGQKEEATSKTTSQG